MLENLYTIDWQNIEDSVANPATYVPGLVEDLLSEDPAIREKSVSNFHFGLTYNMGCVAEATLYVLPFLLELLEYPDIPSHATILEVIDIFLCASAGEKYWGYAIALYHAIYDQQEVFKRFVDHCDVNVRLEAFSILCSFKEDDLELIGWLVGKIRVEHNIEAKAQQLSRVIHTFSDRLSFSFYRMWCLEQAGRLLCEKNAWLQLDGALAILRINQEQTDACVIDFLIDLILKWGDKDCETSNLSDIQPPAIYQIYWDFKYLGNDRNIDALLRLLERVTNADFAESITWCLLDAAFPTWNHAIVYSSQQKAILKFLANKPEIWKYDEPNRVFESHGIPATRAEMQKLVTW